MSSVPILGVVVCLVALCRLAHAEFAFSCDDNIITASPPVVNETAYGYHVLISIEGKNQTLQAYELYDAANGSLVLYVDFPNETHSYIWLNEMIHHDYNYNQTFHVMGGWKDKKTCSVSDLMHNETYSIFGLGIENGFQNPEFSYRWTGDYNYTQGNETVINGIPADVYSTCLTFNNSQIKYDVDLYFSADNWNMKSGKKTPMMIVLKVNQTQDGGENFQDEKYTYSFTSYHRTSSHGYSMYLPDDVVCPGRKDSIEFPEVSNNFAVTQEMINKKHKKIGSWRVHNNYEEKLYRVDFVAPKNISRPNAPRLFHHPYTIIHDFHAGVEYLIDKEMGNCTISPITNQFMWDHFDVESDPTQPGFFRMRNEVDFIKALNFTYTGRHTSSRSGLSIDSWTSTHPHVTKGSWGKFEMNETYMYTTPDWSNGDLSPVPVGVKVSMKITSNGTTRNNDILLHFSDVKRLGHGIPSFEIGMCHDSQTKKSYVLKFSGFFSKYIGEYSSQIDVAAQAAVASAADISKIRVSSFSNKEIGLDQSSGNGDASDRLFVTVTLYGQPDVHGNTSEYAVGTNLTTAISNLKSTVENNEFEIRFQILSGETIAMTAFPSYFVEREDLYAPPPSKSGQTTKGLSSGAVAAVAIAMAVLGFIIGAVVCHFKYKRGNTQFGYGIQD